MGKMGALLREQKKKNVIYTFTKEQLILHDDHVRREYREEFLKLYDEQLSRQAEEQQKKLEEVVNAEYDRMNQYYYNKDPSMRTINWMEGFIAIGVDALVEIFTKTFKWKSEKRMERLKNAFLKGVTDRVNYLANNDNMELKSYSEELYKKHGLAVARETEEE